MTQHQFKIGDRVAIKFGYTWEENFSYTILTITGETATRWKLQRGEAITKDRLKVIGYASKYAEPVTEKHLEHNARVKERFEIAWLREKLCHIINGSTNRSQLTTIYAAIVSALADTASCSPSQEGG
jgi:hypothetical protein